jgi:hypothetical protein
MAPLPLIFSFIFPDNAVYAKMFAYKNYRNLQIGYRDHELISMQKLSSTFDLNITASGNHVITIGGSKIISESAAIEFLWRFCCNYSINSIPYRIIFTHMDRTMILGPSRENYSQRKDTFRARPQNILAEKI